MDRYWKIHNWSNDRIVITPPKNINDEYDDLILEIKGNMLEEDKIKIATDIVSKLNSDI